MSIKKKNYKPGPGWKHLAGAVWEHSRGTRVHSGGLIKTSKGKFYSINKWPDYLLFLPSLKANSGNRKRALMAWANQIESSQVDEFYTEY